LPEVAPGICGYGESKPICRSCYGPKRKGEGQRNALVLTLVHNCSNEEMNQGTVGLVRTKKEEETRKRDL